MDSQIFLTLVICIQGLSSGLASPPEGVDRELTDEDKAKIDQELQKLRDHGENLKKEMQKYSSSFPGLGQMISMLVNSVNNQAASFVQFNQNRLSDPNNKSEDTRFRKSFEAVKNLEQGFKTELQDKFGNMTPEAASPSASGNAATTPTKRRRSRSARRAASRGGASAVDRTPSSASKKDLGSLLMSVE